MISKDIEKKIYNYCAYQERCLYDVKSKMNSLKIKIEYQNYLIDKLQKYKFIDENRFCKNFIYSKINQKKWGELKIKIELKKKYIDNNIITHHLNQVPKQYYIKNIRNIISKYLENIEYIDVKNITKIKNRLIYKGYCLEMINSIISDYNL